MILNDITTAIHDCLVHANTKNTGSNDHFILPIKCGIKIESTFFTLFFFSWYLHFRQELYNMKFFTLSAVVVTVLSVITEAAVTR